MRARVIRAIDGLTGGPMIVTMFALFTFLAGFGAPNIWYAIECWVAGGTFLACLASY